MKSKLQSKLDGKATTLLGLVIIYGTSEKVKSNYNLLLSHFLLDLKLGTLYKLNKGESSN